MKMKPAVFIDKDGTLIENVPFNVDPAQLRFMTGALQALRAFADAGFALIVVTNQSGLARKFFTRAEFDRLQQALEWRLFEEADIKLDDFVLCPHAPGLTEQPVCVCRKPAPGMLTRAAFKHGLDLARSWIVGDTLDDIEAGHRAGCRGALLDSGGETVWRRSPLRQPDAHCHSWAEVRQAVLGVRSCRNSANADLASTA